MVEITRGEWLVEFPEEMDSAKINRIITRTFRQLESEGIKLTLKEKNESNNDTHTSLERR